MSYFTRTPHYYAILWENNNKEHSKVYCQYKMVPNFSSNVEFLSIKEARARSLCASVLLIFCL